MGRSAILLVMGMSTIFLMFGKKFGEIGLEAMSNALSYYEASMRNDIAKSAAHIACNKLFVDHYWGIGQTPYSNVPFNDGTFTIKVDTIGFKTKDTVRVTAVGVYTDAITLSNKSDTIIVVLTASDFSKFAMYTGSQSNGAKLGYKDTINGPLQVNGALSTNGKVVFNGKVTAGSYVKDTTNSKSNSAVFNGGIDVGVNIPFPNDSAQTLGISTDASSGGISQTGGVLWVVFDASGDVYYTSDAVTAAKTVSTAQGWTKKTAASFTKKAIAITGGELHIQGTVKGNFSVASIKNSSGVGGTTKVDGQLKYNTYPTTSGASDMLGVVSDGDITVMNDFSQSKENVPNGQQGRFNMFGAFYTAGTLRLADAGFNNGQRLNVYGSLMQRTIDPAAWGNNSSNGNNHSESLTMTYDVRLQTMSPTNFPFPKTGYLEVISWYE